MNPTIQTGDDPLEKTHRNRSNYIRSLVTKISENSEIPEAYSPPTPRRIVQFWHDLEQLPGDVRHCMESWSQLEEIGFERHVFDLRKAGDFIDRRLGKRYRKTFEKCCHPAMHSDYFRLCYIFSEGGCYVDSDDVYLGVCLDPLFSDGRLKLQPLCYDISTDGMIPPSIFTSPTANSLSWIIYFNNNPLIAASGHPVIERALLSATNLIEKSSSAHFPDIQSTTGPGNLSKSIYDLSQETNQIENSLLIVRDWVNIASTKWSLCYRNDGRNWRLADRYPNWRDRGHMQLEEER